RLRSTERSQVRCDARCCSAHVVRDRIRRLCAGARACLRRVLGSGDEVREERGRWPRGRNLQCRSWALVPQIRQVWGGSWHTYSKGGGQMNKILLTVAVLGTVGSFAGPAMAQGKQGEAFGSEVSSQCAHRRVMPPDPRDDCARKLRGDTQLGY